MKRLLAVLLVFVVLLLCGCTPTTTTTNTSDPEPPAAENTVDTSQNAFEVDYFETATGNQSYYFKTTHDEIITAINKALSDAGYPPFVLDHTYTSPNDDLSDSYYYQMEGHFGRLDIQVFHGNGYLYLINLGTFHDESQLAVDQFLIKTLAELFAPGQGQTVYNELGVDNVRPGDPSSHRSYSLGNTDFELSVPSEFEIVPSKD